VNNLARNLILAGLGLASMTEEKAKEFYNKLIDYGKKYEESDETVMSGFVKSYDRASEKLDEISSDLIDSISEKLNLISKKEYEALNGRITALEKDIAYIKSMLENLKKD
jgi:polyhydroxyalkanoate synthesis regulator phasin